MVDLLGQPCRAERAPRKARPLSPWWPQRECAAALRWSHGTPSALSRTASLDPLCTLQDSQPGLWGPCVVTDHASNPEQ